MSKNKNAAPDESAPAQDDTAADEKMSIPDIRLGCLKLAHSASKSVLEVLLDAAAYTDWVMDGKMPERKD